MKFFTFLLLFAFVCACSSPSDKNTSLRAVVDGPWTSGCIALSPPDTFASYEIRLELARASIYDRRERYFKDSACQEQLGEVRFQGTYELSVTPTEFVYLIDIEIEKLSALASNEVGRQTFENLRYCGVSAWTTGKEEDIGLSTSLPCRSFGAVPFKNWNLLAIRRGQSLSFGADLSPDNLRPDQIEEEAPNRKFAPVRLNIFDPFTGKNKRRDCCTTPFTGVR